MLRLEQTTLKRHGFSKHLTHTINLPNVSKEDVSVVNNVRISQSSVTGVMAFGQQLKLRLGSNEQDIGAISVGVHLDVKQTYYQKWARQPSVLSAKTSSSSDDPDVMRNVASVKGPKEKKGLPRQVKKSNRRKRKRINKTKSIKPKTVDTSATYTSHNNDCGQKDNSLGQKDHRASNSKCVFRTGRAIFTPRSDLSSLSLTVETGKECNEDLSSENNQLVVHSNGITLVQRECSGAQSTTKAVAQTTKQRTERKCLKLRSAQLVSSRHLDKCAKQGVHHGSVFTLSGGISKIEIADSTSQQAHMWKQKKTLKPCKGITFRMPRIG